MSIWSLGHVFCLPHCSFAAAAGYGTQKDTLTVSLLLTAGEGGGRLHTARQALLNVRPDDQPVKQEQQPRQNEQHNIATTSNIYTHLHFTSKVASANAIMGVYPSL